METFSRHMLAPYAFIASVRAASTELPRAISGRSVAIDFTAGGYVAAEYGQIPIVSAEQHRYLNRIARKYSGGRAGLIVPIINDDLLPDGISVSTGITHSDGTTFSDGTGYAQSGATAWLVGDHILNAGTLTFELIAGGAELNGGEWFAIRHPNKHWRAYCIWTVDEVDETGVNPIYTVGIQPPLREATANGTEIDLTRPRFLGQLAPQTSIPGAFRAADISRLSITFVERFEVD